MYRGCSWLLEWKVNFELHISAISLNTISGNFGAKTPTVVNIYPRQDIILDVFETYDPNAKVSHRKAIDFTTASLLQREQKPLLNSRN